ncbi:MAG: pyridoxamine 5'-phosphate oxidase family protein, partial [Nitrososphaeraceae archaeon]
MNDSTTSGVKIFNAHSKLGTPPLNAKELTEFLRTPELLVRLGTIDEKGEPDDVRPTWYYFDSLNDRLYVGTNKKLSKMVRNLEKNKIISFCIDDSRPDQYKGVRGKGDVTIHEDVKYTALIFENIA